MPAHAPVYMPMPARLPAPPPGAVWGQAPQGLPAQPVMQPRRMPAQPAMQAQPPAPRMPVPAALAATSGTSLPPTAARGNPDDDPPLPPGPAAPVQAAAAPAPPPAPPRLTLPDPEQLGIRAAAPAPPAVAEALDWNAAHARLDRLGAVRFQSDRLPQGGFRVTFLLPASAAQTYHVEATAATEAAAVQTALHRAETWAAGR
jgi:hypothetical protein